MSDLEQAIRERRSTRMFLPQRPAPRELVDEALALAVCAPSNTNIQPWHMVFVSGAARDPLVTALLAEARSKPPEIPPLPEAFAHIRSELGAQVSGSMGIAREDTKAGGLGFCATGSSWARRWPASSVSTATSDRSTASASECFCRHWCWH